MTLTPKQARVGVNMSQREIADELGIHVHTYMKYEANPEDMSIRLAKKFARVVGLRVDDIFLLDDSTDNRKEG